MRPRRQRLRPNFAATVRACHFCFCARFPIERFLPGVPTRRPGCYLAGWESGALERAEVWAASHCRSNRMAGAFALGPVRRDLQRIIGFTTRQTKLIRQVSDHLQKSFNRFCSCRSVTSTMAGRAAATRWGCIAMLLQLKQ